MSQSLSSNFCTNKKRWGGGGRNSLAAQWLGLSTFTSEALV